MPTIVCDWCHQQKYELVGIYVGREVICTACLAKYHVDKMKMPDMPKMSKQELENEVEKIEARLKEVEAKILSGRG